MKLNDLLLGLLVLLGGAVILVSAAGFSPIPGQAYGAGTMPRAISFVALGLGVYLVARAMLAGERRPRIELTDWPRSPRLLLGLAAAVAAVVAYIFLSGRIGYLPTAFGLTTVLMLIRGVRPLTAIVVALVATFAIQQAFGRLLLVPIPRSPFLDFMW